MKNYKLTLLALVALITFSCSKDETTSSNNDSDTGSETYTSNIQSNSAEEAYIEVEDVEGGIIIEGATLESGSLTPNELTSFELDATEYTGLQGEGFEMVLQVESDYAGAYIQLLEEDGSMSSNYFDVPNPFSYVYRSTPKSKVKPNVLSHRSAVKTNDTEDEITIDIDFEETVTEGTFCYVICVYDTNGNISAPIEVCVEVEAWGGNSDVVGEWDFIKTVEYADGVFDGQFIAGVTECFDISPYNCYTSADSYEEVTFSKQECELINEGVLTLNADGTMELYDKYTDSYYDNVEGSDNWCEYEYNTYVEETRYTGNWSYDEESNELFIVAFEETIISHTKNGEDYVSPWYEDFTSELMIEATVETLNGTELVLKDEYLDGDYDFESDTFFNVTYTNYIYFEK